MQTVLFSKYLFFSEEYVAASACFPEITSKVNLRKDTWDIYVMQHCKYGPSNLPLVLDDGRTYDEKGSKEVWLAAVNLVSRQSTTQLIVFTHRIPRVRAAMIFRGAGKRIKALEGWLK